MADLMLRVGDCLACSGLVLVALFCFVCVCVLLGRFLKINF